MIACKKCGFIPYYENDIHLHHIIPKKMGGTDKDGRVYLCKRCHDEIHILISFLEKEKIKEYTLGWISNVA